MSTIYITSIDDVLSWLGVEYDRNLPDPSIVNDRYWRRPILPSLDQISFKVNGEIPTISEIKSEDFVKDRIGFNGKFLWVWRKV